MGQGGSKLLSEQKQLQKIYTIDYRLKEDNLTYLTSKENGQQYLLREIIYNEEPEYLEMLRKLQQRKTIKSPYITQLKRVENFKEENLCSKYFHIYTLWEYPRKTLAEEINDRALLKQPFEQFQLRTLLLHISQGLATFQQNRKGHECLTTKTILIPQRFNSKVVDILAYPLHPNLDVIYHKRSIKNVYLSPEQCKIIQSQSFSNLSSDPFKEDVFIGGMIMIESALLERQQDCYENDYETVNFKKIGQRLDMVESKYGRQLRLIIESMVHPHTENRTSWKNIAQKLNSDRTTGYQTITLKVIEPIIREPVVRHSLPGRSLVQTQKIVVPTPPPVQLRSSFAFSYNASQIERERPVAAIQRVQQVSSVNRPVINHLQATKVIRQLRPQTLKFSNSNTKYVVHSHLNSFRPNHYEAPNLQNKFIPIAIQASKYKYIKQTVLPTNIVNTANKQYMIHSSQQNSQKPNILPPEVKNFSLNLNDPIFSIDEYGEGKRYQGYKLNGKKEGQGKFFLDDKLCFQGSWKNDLMEGQGKLFYHSGKLAYEGNFQRDRFHGYGKLYNEYPENSQEVFNYRDFDEIQQFWISYEGEFEDDLKQGKGQLFLTNGDHFQGIFHKDSVQGQGVYTTKQGQVIRGVWSQNKLLKLIQ